MTEKVFWKDPYLTKLNAKVTRIEDKKINVDKTIFYAFSGGQESDEGTIGGIKVINAVKIGDKENIIDIDYELENLPEFKVGDTVEISINSEKRDKIRRLHSASHLIYYFTIEKIGQQEMIGSNLTSEKARLDFLLNKPISEFLIDIEKRTNDFLDKPHEIIRSFDENNPDLLWWVCEEWKMPCGGIHVKNTSEIGKIKLKRKNIGAGKERIEIYLL